MKKTLKDIDVAEKIVLVREDYNVPLKNGTILDDTKIRASLETLNYLLEQNCKIILLSHLGKVKTEQDKYKYSLKPIAEKLKSLIQREVYFVSNPVDPTLKERISVMKPKDILLLENTRYLDVPNRLESNCDIQLASFWAGLADVFVMDAFASSHRAHASVVGIPKFLPSCIGFQVQKELTTLNALVRKPKEPFTVVMGGAKVEDKIELLEALLPKCDHILLAGALANTLVQLLGFEIGGSVVTNDRNIREKLKKILFDYKDKIVLPFDAICGSTYDETFVKYRRINEIDPNDVILDVGVKTIEVYKDIINKSRTVFCNGTMGLYEDIRFSNGTKEFFKILSKTNAITVVGGGDSTSALKNFGFEDSVTYVSTGGGATLKYIATGSLKGIDCISEVEEIEVLDL